MLVTMKRKCSKKLGMADQVSALIKSGDCIFFAESALRLESLNEALARRVSELEGVMVDNVCITKVPRFLR